MRLIKNLVFVVICSFTMIACSKESETFSTATIADYSPLIVGKYVTYQLDSTVFVNFGTAQEIRSYQVKYTVDAVITDNLGRPAYRIFRSIRKTAAQPFVPDATFTAVNTGNGLEFTENNLRYIKLRLPIRNGYSWKGNSFIETSSSNSNLRYLADWDYTYADVHTSKKVGTFTFDSTLTVMQRADSSFLPVTSSTIFADKNVSKEIYAKNVGLVFRDFIHFEYQGVSKTYTGYGVKYTIIDKN